MSAALRYEWVRLTTLRSTWWLTGIAVLLGTGIALLFALAINSGIDDGPSPEDLRVLPGAVASQAASVFVPYLLGFVVAMIGVFAWGHEYRHGMIRSTLTAVPSRTSVWAAKFLVVGVWVAVVSAVAGVLSLLVGALALSGSGVPILSVADGWQMVGRCVVYTVLLTWLVAAFTAVVRQQVVALVLMFLWPFLVENIVQGVVTFVPALDPVQGVVRFLPFDAGLRIIRVVNLAGTDDPLSAWQGTLVFGAFTVVLAVASLVLFQRRDA